MAASELALLLGTAVGHKLTGAGLKLGSLAAIGRVAYNAFQKWQSQQATPIADAGKPLTELSGAASEQRGKTLLRAMIAAAKADGNLDDKEKELITQQLAKLNLVNQQISFWKNSIILWISKLLLPVLIRLLPLLKFI